MVGAQPSYILQKATWCHYISLLMNTKNTPRHWPATISALNNLVHFVCPFQLDFNTAGRGNEETNGYEFHFSSLGCTFHELGDVPREVVHARRSSKSVKSTSSLLFCRRYPATTVKFKGIDQRETCSVLVTQPVMLNWNDHLENKIIGKLPLLKFL